MSNQQNASALSSTVSKFSHAVAALGVLLLVPLLEQHLRAKIYAYFIATFSHDIAIWGSWGSVAVIGLCGFFGCSAILQVIIQMILRRAVRRAIF